jgi:hypothetical protein
MARILSLAPNSATAVPAVKAAVRGYRASETSARDLILIFWNVMDQNLDDTASIVNALVDFIDEDEKKTDILGAWNGFKIEVCSKLISFQLHCGNVISSNAGSFQILFQPPLALVMPVLQVVEFSM